MRKKIIPGVLIALAFGALLYLNMQRPEVAPVTPTEENKMTLDAPPTSTGAVPTTLDALLGQNTSQECSYTSNEGGVERYGSVSMSGGKMRVEAQERALDGTVRSSSMLLSDGYYYVWGDGMDGGIKMPVADLATGGAPQGERPPVDLQATMTYECNRIEPSSALFELPSDVTFTDLGAMMQSIPGVPTDAMDGETPTSADAIKAAMCAACEQAGDPNGECRKTYKCDE